MTGCPRLPHTHEVRLLRRDRGRSCAAVDLADDSFLTLQNLFDLLTSYAFTGILRRGLLVVLVSGEIDISFTATASVAQYVAMLGNAYPSTGPSAYFLSPARSARSRPDQRGL